MDGTTGGPSEITDSISVKNAKAVFGIGSTVTSQSKRRTREVVDRRKLFIKDLNIGIQDNGRAAFGEGRVSVEGIDRGEACVERAVGVVADDSELPVPVWAGDPAHDDPSIGQHRHV